MPFVKGSKHSDATRKLMSESRRGRKHTDAHKKNISAANKGRIFPKIHEGTCRCGKTFLSASPFAVYCSRKCRRAANGHGIRHAPEFAHFDQRCAICGADDKLVGDHDHETGKARGILCRPCNLAH